MAQGQPPQSWWTTVPGILTASAAVITAVGGLIGVLYKDGGFNTKRQSPIEFKIVSRLMPGFISEDIQIYIQGQPPVNLVVNEGRTTAEAKIKVPKAGSYTYTVLGEGILSRSFYPRRDRGEGEIEVSEGSVFEVRPTPQGISLITR